MGSSVSITHLMLADHFSLNSYSFDLDSERIAQNPASRRIDSKLLNALDWPLQDLKFSQLPELIEKNFPKGVLFVTNNTEVMRARLIGRKTSGGKVETLLFESKGEFLWRGFFKPGRRLQVGTEIYFSEENYGVIQEKHHDGSMTMRWHGRDSVMDFMQNHGILPLPPYIKKFEGDPGRYQTVYAKIPGASAAPTAGLHFNQEIMDELRDLGCDFTELTLHVGPGTFKSIEQDDVRDYQIHGEWINVPEDCVKKVGLARTNGQPIVCVGTTALRSLEAVERLNGLNKSWQGITNIYIYPGQTIGSCDYLLTNFHLPCSSLLVLIAAFTGFDLYKKMYDHAISGDYRFFSFGDCMLLKNNS